MWQRLQPREKMMLALLGCFGLCVVLFKFVLIPQFSAYGYNKAKLEDLRSKVLVAEAAVRSEKTENEIADQANDLLNEIKPLFDNEMNDGLALVQIGLKALESNVEIISFKPSNLVDKGIYHELPLNFEVRGDYHNVSDFISKVEALPDLSEIRTLKIKPYEGKKASEQAGAVAQKQALPEKVPVEVIPMQNGSVTATFDLVAYTSPTPASRLKLEQVVNWAVGRYNAFLTPDYISPYPGIKPLERKVDPYTAQEGARKPKSEIPDV